MHAACASTPIARKTICLFKTSHLWPVAIQHASGIAPVPSVSLAFHVVGVVPLLTRVFDGRHDFPCLPVVALAACSLRFRDAMTEHTTPLRAIGLPLYAMQTPACQNQSEHPLRGSCACGSYAWLVQPAGIVRLRLKPLWIGRSPSRYMNRSNGMPY